MADLCPGKLAEQGMNGWTTMPVFGSPIWLTVITTLVLGVGIGVLAQPQLVVRFMTAKNNKSLNRAVLIGGPFILMMTGVAFTVGALTNVYFYQTSGKIAVQMAPGGNVDTIIPIFINSAMPDWFVVLFMVTLLAAAMSTLSSLFHTMGTALICDVWGRGRECSLSMIANQIGILIMIMASVIIAFLMPGSIIAIATAMFMGLCASAFLPVFAVAVYCKKPDLWLQKPVLLSVPWSGLSGLSLSMPGMRPYSGSQKRFWKGRNSRLSLECNRSTRHSTAPFGNYHPHPSVFTRRVQAGDTDCLKGQALFFPPRCFL